MTYIHQFQLEKLKEKLVPGKVIVIYGPRRVGKTTLVQHFLKKLKNYLFVTGEDLTVQSYLSSQSIQKLKEFIGSCDLLVIDEAQAIPNIGLNLKLIVDHIPNLKVIVTGSSIFDLSKEIGEPLTGRKKTLKLFPLSQIELSKVEDLMKTKSSLEGRLIFGSYPEVITANSIQEKSEYLREITNDYLFKDLLSFEGLKKSKKIADLLRLIAFQVGKELSLSELGKSLGLNKITIEKYLDILEQAFIIINIRGFSRNLRKEVTKTSRYYFYDNGVRNALINNFNALSFRDDIGSIWENYLVVERIKKQEYKELHANNYFWRTYDQKEIDWVEERDGFLRGFEFKWKEKKVKAPKIWKETYANSSFDVIHQNNYLDFIT